MKEASHTKLASSSTLRLLPEVGLVDVADPSLSGRLAGKVSEQLEAFASQMREGLLAASVAMGLDVMGELIDADVTDVAGPKGRHDPNRTANRHGTEDGKVTLGGRRIPVRRPRVGSVADEDGLEREVRLESYLISDDRDRLDRDLVHRFLRDDSYWSQAVPRDVVDKSIDNSLCFGLYDGAEQVGFARLVTDRSTFAFLADVFVLPSHRGRGLAKSLLDRSRPPGSGGGPPSPARHR